MARSCEWVSVSNDLVPPIAARRVWLGHVSLETTNRYAEITVRMKEAAMKLGEPTGAGLPMRKPAWRDDAALLTWLSSL